MSDIVIRNIEMPKVCGLCPCFHAETPMYCQADKTIKMTAPYGKKMEGCPLVEIPEHGDLIDRDLLWTATIGNVYHAPYITKKELNEAPTVLEASK